MILLISIILSILIVFLDSVISFNRQYGHALWIAEWVFTILFSLEYALRIYASQKPMRYIFSFYGIIDLLAILPTYLSLLFAGSQYLIVIRIFRLLRIFRILKLDRYIGASSVLFESLRSSRHKIIVFLSFITAVAVIMGALMYLIEGPVNGFTSIPESIYWAIVTLTTVGYGDISPHTFLGKAVASIIMVMGYSIIAVPTGIITAELTNRKLKEKSLKKCPGCDQPGHDKDAKYCFVCGTKL
jgi:voltage-gated potassium channel